MVFLIISLIILSLTFFMFSLPIVELILALFIGVPIVFFILAMLGLNFGVSYIISILLMLTLILSISKFKINKKAFSSLGEYSYFLVFFISFLVLYTLSLRWADFVTIGERLRDYSILSSVIKSPINLQEPWFAGFTLNYYAFWYRLGSAISFIFDIPVWNTYHIVASLNTAFFFTCIFIIVKKYLNFNFLQSLFLALIVFPGTNYRSIKFFFSQDTNWWGPSRVIKGAITEFPTWSFVLGDLHPHFLNLLCFPFLISLVLLIDPLKWNVKEKLVLFFVFLFVPILFIFNANAWDIPAYFLLFCVYLTAVLILKYNYHKKFNYEDSKVKNGIFIFLFIMLLAFSLFLSSRNITSVGAILKFVTGEVLRTNTYEFIDAFGIPFFFITIFSILLCKNKLRNIFSSLLVFSLLFFDLAIFPIITLLFFTIFRVFDEIDENYRESLQRKKILFEAVGISVLVLWLVPEIIYLDDNYGAGNERMNTIFKIYSVAWSLSYIYTFYLLRRVVDKYHVKNLYVWIGLVPVTVICTLCFFKFIELRTFNYTVSLNERIRGLNEVDKFHSGAKNAIDRLTKMSDGIVLESTKGAYNYASHVGTLSGKTLFLGWQNHVQLLYKKYDEIQKRKEEIDRFYTNMNCDERRRFLINNNISYVVLGPLEKEEYRERLNNDFYCLDNIIQEGEYIIFTGDK